jgi:hypothetical protein
MDIQQLLDSVSRQSRRRGLPEDFIARYVEELREHITDLIEERNSTMSKDARTESEVIARIGPPDVLVEAASHEFARRSFFGRHPILTFLVAPIPLAVFAWVATFAALFGCGAGIAMLAEQLWAGRSTDFISTAPTALNIAFAVIFWLGVVLPPAVLTAFICRLARRNGLNWRWSLAGCVLVALTAGLFQAVLEPADPDGHGRLMFGFGLWLFPPLQQWLQFAFPLTIGLWLLWRQSRSHRDGMQSPPDAMLVNQQAA